MKSQKQQKSSSPLFWSSWCSTGGNLMGNPQSPYYRQSKPYVYCNDKTSYFSSHKQLYPKFGESKIPKTTTYIESQRSNFRQRKLSSLKYIRDSKPIQRYPKYQYLNERDQLFIKRLSYTPIQLFRTLAQCSPKIKQMLQKEKRKRQVQRSYQILRSINEANGTKEQLFKLMEQREKQANKSQQLYEPSTQQIQQDEQIQIPIKKRYQTILSQIQQDINQTNEEYFQSIKQNQKNIEFFNKKQIQILQIKQIKIQQKQKQNEEQKQKQKENENEREKQQEKEKEKERERQLQKEREKQDQQEKWKEKERQLQKQQEKEREKQKQKQTQQENLKEKEKRQFYQMAQKILQHLRILQKINNSLYDSLYDSHKKSCCSHKQQKQILEQKDLIQSQIKNKQFCVQNQIQFNFNLAQNSNKQNINSEQINKNDMQLKKQRQNHFSKQENNKNNKFQNWNQKETLLNFNNQLDSKTRTLMKSLLLSNIPHNQNVKNSGSPRLNDSNSIMLLNLQKIMKDKQQKISIIDSNGFDSDESLQSLQSRPPNRSIQLEESQ